MAPIEETNKIAENNTSYSTAEGKEKNVVKEGKTKSGKRFVRVIGGYEQAELVRQKYLDLKIKVSLLNKDKYNEDGYYFYIDDDLDNLVEVTGSEVACTKEDTQIINRKNRGKLIQELREFRLKKSR